MPRCHHLFTVRLENREAGIKELTAEGIGTGIYYRLPIHLQKAYADLNYQAGSFPVSERAAATVVSIPMFPELTREQLEFAAGAMRKTRQAAVEA